MTEYWLQKKTLIGWSIVTWYDNIEQAETNYNRLRQSAGYSYRMVKVEVVQEHLLDEVTKIEVSELEEPIKVPKPWADVPAIVPTTPTWGATTTAPVEVHGMAGKIWLINHAKKQKRRVAPDEVEALIAQGWERGGPKTAFK